MKSVIETTDAEDSILIPYAKIQGVSLSDLIASNGKENAVQGALRHYASHAARTGAVDPAVAAAVCKDENAVFQAITNDWRGDKKFSGVMSAVLQGKAGVASAASKEA